MTNLATRLAAIACTAVFSATMILGAIAPAHIGAPTGSTLQAERMIA